MNFTPIEKVLEQLDGKIVIERSIAKARANTKNVMQIEGNTK